MQLSTEFWWRNTSDLTSLQLLSPSPSCLTGIASASLSILNNDSLVFSNMTNQTFFDKWVGRTIEFTNTPEPTRWVLETKYAEHSSQFTAAEHFEYEGMKGKSSVAYGSFRSWNMDRSEEVAVMKIVMQ